MDINSFFGTPKWRILELLAQKPLSPSELSGSLSTSVAYVSQQLKLLEAAGLIVKEKTGSADKGKPRSLYSLSKEIFSLAVLARGWSSKKTFSLTDHHKLILRIWLLENVSVHYYIEKIYWSLEKNIGDVEGIFFSDNGVNEVIVLSESKTLKQRIESLVKDVPTIAISFFSRNEFLKKPRKKLFAIYDPLKLLAEGSGEKEVTNGL